MIRKVLIGAVAALTISLSTIGTGATPATAEVTYNAKLPATLTLTNPCNGLLITLTGDYHTLWYTTPEGHTIMRTNARYTGTDTAGTEYIVNIRRVMDHDLWPAMFPFDDLIVYNGVSHGKGENFRITRSVEDWPGPGTPAYTVESVCQG